MRISVFGLGYVGCVSAACFAARGHEVVGVDVNPEKVAMLGGGKAPVLEQDLPALIAETTASGRLRATTDAAEAVLGSDVSLVCVGTPSSAHGALSTDALERVSEQIGAALARVERRHTVVYRSTMLPGTTEEKLVPVLERASGRHAGRDFGICMNPEFLREGTSVRDFADPPKTVIGELDTASGDVVESLYANLDAPLFRVPLRVAELVKYVDNAFHALKVGFANEIGALSRELGVDSHRVMEIFRADTKLNISPAYLTPGFAFGGSCLPKDLRALVYHAGKVDVHVPILEHVLVSNEEQMRRTLELIAQFGRKRVGIFGLAFKPGTDDLRESPLVDLSERLLGKGYALRIYDANVSLSHLTGANRAYIEEHLPHIRELLAPSVDEVLEHAEICVVGSRDADVVDAIARANGRIVLDLVRLPEEGLRQRPGYVGIGW